MQYETFLHNDSIINELRHTKLRHRLIGFGQPCRDDIGVFALRYMIAKKQHTFIDLFAGCGGLSEGFYKQGFKALAHVEIDKYCCETLRERMRYYGYAENDIMQSVIETDITKESVVSRLDKVVGRTEVDLVIGGPPCQAYSTAGRARDEFGMKNDPRNYLFEHYVKILNHFNPKFFVFENVIGLLSANINGVRILDLVFKALKEKFYIIEQPNTMLFNTANFGVPQVRKRLIIIGVRKDLNIKVESLYESMKPTHSDPDMDSTLASSLKPFVTVKDAISDLPHILKGEKRRSQPFCPNANNDFLNWVEDKNANTISDHITRNQNDVDTERYSEMAKNHWTFEQLLQNRPDLNHPKQRVFNNSYTVQFWDMPARTIIAHLSKDGNQFIHPDASQGRSISVREAARLQSFPDDFKFCGAMCQQFKQIGNAVPPLFAEVVAKNLKKYIESI